MHTQRRKSLGRPIQQKTAAFLEPVSLQVGTLRTCTTKRTTWAVRSAGFPEKRRLLPFPVLRKLLSPALWCASRRLPPLLAFFYPVLHSVLLSHSHCTSKLRFADLCVLDLGVSLEHMPYPLHHNSLFLLSADVVFLETRDGNFRAPIKPDEVKSGEMHFLPSENDDVWVPSGKQHPIQLSYTTNRLVMSIPGAYSIPMFAIRANSST